MIHDNSARQSSRDQIPGEPGILEVRPGCSRPVFFFSSSYLLPSIVGLGIHCKHSNPAMDPIKETVY